LYCGSNSSPLIENLTLASNSAQTSGGGISCEDSSPSIIDCIIAFSGGGEGVYCQGSAVPTITHCCVFGNAGGDSLCGSYYDNIFVDPAFCDTTGGVFWLQDCSPCVGTGTGGDNIGAWDVGCGCGDPTGIHDTDAWIPTQMVLHAASPNPFSEDTALCFELLRDAGAVKVAICNLRGQLVSTLVDGLLAPGRRTVRWDGTDDRGAPVSSAVYFVRYEAQGRCSTRKLVVLR